MKGFATEDRNGTYRTPIGTARNGGPEEKKEPQGIEFSESEREGAKKRKEAYEGGGETA